MNILKWNDVTLTPWLEELMDAPGTPPTQKAAHTVTISSGGKRRDDSLNPIVALVRRQLIELVSEHSNRASVSDGGSKKP